MRVHQSSLVVVMVVVLCGCSASDSRYRQDLARVERSLQDLRALQAEQSAQITAIEGSLHTLQGRYEVASRDAAVPGVMGGASNLSQALHPLVPADLLAEDEALAETIPGEAGRLLRNALVKVREGSFAEAIPIVEQAISLSFGTQLLPRLFFWKGVCFDGLGDLKGALASYNDLISGFPENALVPATLLRQASLFVRLRDSQLAKLTLQKLIAEYPSSPAAAEAREKIRKL